MDQHLTDLADGDGVSVHAGFPNPAADHRGQGARLSLDLNQLLVRHPVSTYLFRIAGHQWSDQGVYDGDIAIIDRAAQQRPESLVIAWQNGSFNLCRQRQLDGPGQAWGVVTAIIHLYNPKGV